LERKNAGFFRQQLDAEIILFCHPSKENSQACRHPVDVDQTQAHPINITPTPHHINPDRR
jgi:hypothetical protein